MRPSLLLIDDDTEVIKLLRLFLEAEFEVESSNDPNWCLTRISQKKYDLVVTDLNMTEVSGIMILRQVQKHQKETPVIMMSGTVVEDLGRMPELGVAATLAKPFHTPDQVLELVKKVLRNSSAD